MNMQKKYYLCGPTVYNYPHIGNLRPTVTFDIMIRAQRYLGEDIYYLNNITDIDDKIIKKAIEKNKTELEISEKYSKYYLELFDTFNLQKPTKIVKVTESLKDMYEYIQLMINNKSAYKIDGNVFFDVRKFKDIYGSVSNQKIDNLVTDESNEYGKKNPEDFALWKSTTEGIKFDSPFGLGRPGWHTECSCFISKYFNGETLDIHGGGIDLIFPHHENENIQHYSIYKKPISKKWMHFGTLNYKNQKMSKSIGNLIFPHDFLKKYSTDTYKLLMLTTNYSKPINLTDELLEANQAIINKFIVIKNQNELKNNNNPIDEQKIIEIITNIANLNFSEAYKEIIKLSKQEKDANTFIKTLSILGFIFTKNKLNKEDIEIYKKWQKLIKDKDYEQADSIRDELKKRNII
ncbi:cysteine--tRNA ligase [Metamycoplasma phocicerebrale]|uniref:Cysteine--tRNA ligase n=1 Tax=Metamycoplasma phocicerebrale TaxID=142649 RepID=A0A3Q9VBK9_9BACT|nr:cysteine--tRNA ligase [Metamycoplasma phocicerebrale]AZZ65444.1 cysteine--tRNA ligase [Metamycoplasma phocicerebrale]